MKAKKQIKKLKSELSEQDRRIEKIEKELARNSSFTLSKDVLRGITEPKLSVGEKPFVLPEKWCVSVTKENVEELSEWRGDKDLIKAKATDGYLHDDLIWLSVMRNGYTEITFEQFLEHVVNANTEPKPVESDNFKNLKIEDVQVNVSDCSEEEIKGLADIFVANGFEVHTDEHMIIPTKTHYFLRMAKCKDKVGVFSTDKTKTTLTPSQFREMFGKKEIDWSKANYLDGGDGLIVLTNGKHTEINFQGTILSEDKFHKGDKGLLVYNFAKECFTLCTEPITLKN